MTTALTDYIAAGLALVPIFPREKGPCGIGWNLRENVITNASQLGRLRDMNVGLAHAYCTPTPTCALDVDFYDGAVAWFADHGLDLDSYLDDPTALLIRSGKPQSCKALYRLPSGVAPLLTVKVRNDKQVLFEFRCATKTGATDQDVLPPSLHPLGHRYSWANPANTDPAYMPVLPDPLLELWKSLLQVPTVGSRSVRQGIQATEDTPRARAWLQAALQRLSADCDRDQWRAIVWAILSTGWEDAPDIAEAWSRTAPDLFTERDFEGVVKSYDPQREDTITLGTIVHLLRQLDETEAA